MTYGGGRWKVGAEELSAETTQAVAAGGTDPRYVTRRGLAWALAAVMLVSFSLAGVGILLNNAGRHDSERKWCGIMQLSAQSAQRRVDAFKSEPPTTEAGRVQAQEAVIGLSAVEKLMRDLECPKSKKQ